MKSLRWAFSLVAALPALAPNPVAALQAEAPPSASPASPSAASPPPASAPPAAAAPPSASEPEVTRDQNQSFWDIIGEDDPNPTNYDFAFLSIAMNQNWGIATWKGGGLYFGAGGGLGGPFWRVIQMEGRDVTVDNMLEVVFGNVYLRLAPFKYMDLDLGGKLALGASTYDVSDAPRTGVVRAGYVDLRFGSKSVKFGPRFEYDSIIYSDFTETGWKVTPVMLRVLK